ncbi:MULTISPECIES: ATP-binding protein [Mesorhizobium]|uniref:sensor histidine kinase n=1 Tax=Mesorhizobium TaxID=68287 RepID=UPI0003CF2F10|nr:MULTISPECIES: ATP-binding protein [Mesorhizobium]ESY68904.1 histidine kinase [Mesorhizobium sp. LNHC232B00]WJI40634.1 ATP-binding protein [Mesorhizobium opportunistum]
MEFNTGTIGRRDTENAGHEKLGDFSRPSHVTSLVEFAASVAHETNQPLAAVITNGEAGIRWLGRGLPNIEAARTSLERVVSNARRASDVIDRLRALARNADAEHFPLSVNDIIDETLLLLQRELVEHRIEVSLSLDPILPRVLGDRVQLQQVIINLVINAIQAMDAVDGRVLQIASQSAEGRVVIEVMDNGQGFAPANSLKLFNAFYSTKTEGMGMGLSICRSIVEAHNGEITASAGNKCGSTFTIRLPIHA